jgi:CBS domain-containing protein
MKVMELMSPHVECTRPDASLQQAAETMKSLDVGSLPVCQEDQLVGMVTDRDIVVRSVCEGHDPEIDHVEDVMTPELVCCFEDQDVSEAAKLMKEKQVRRLPVLNRKKRLVGIVSLGDLAVETFGEQLAEETLEGISEPRPG